MKRVALKRRTPLNRVSTKRASELARYSKLRKKYIELFDICEICRFNYSTDIHHRKGREGDRLNQTIWWLACCRSCHQMAHNNPKWAMSKGYMVSRIAHK